MQRLRRRIPFTLLDDGSEDDTRILDEQEQDEIIQHLRLRTNVTNAHYILATQIILILSIILHLIQASKYPPFLVFLSLLVHCNLFLYLLPSRIRKKGRNIQVPSPFSFQLTYVLAAVAPTLSLFIRHPWQTTLWWCITPGVVYTVYSVKETIYEANQNIAMLENMKYTAPGA